VPESVQEKILQKLNAAKEARSLRELDPQVGTTTAQMAVMANEARLDGEHKRSMRVKISTRILITLWIELAILAAMIGLQGFKPWGFSLNDWIFGIFVNGVLLQTFFTVQIIVKNLFPHAPGERG
jgi:hypothetical protein